jgi:hypothetical protein
MKDCGGVAGEDNSRVPSGGDGVSSPLEFKTATRSPLPAMGRVDDSTGKAWNTKSLLPRLGTDALAAASAGFLVAPIITIIDR